MLNINTNSLHCPLTEQLYTNHFSDVVALGQVYRSYRCLEDCKCTASFQKRWHYHKYPASNISQCTESRSSQNLTLSRDLYMLFWWVYDVCIHLQEYRLRFLVLDGVFFLARSRDVKRRRSPLERFYAWDVKVVETHLKSETFKSSVKTERIEVDESIRKEQNFLNERHLKHWLCSVVSGRVGQKCVLVYGVQFLYQTYLTCI